MHGEGKAYCLPPHPQDTLDRTQKYTLHHFPANALPGHPEGRPALFYSWLKS